MLPPTVGTASPRATDSPITQLLSAANNGDPAATADLMSALHHELRAMAAAQTARDKPGVGPQATTIVQEVYLRIFGNGPVDFANRRHFFAAAAETMRRIRIDDARKRKRDKRGGGKTPVSLDGEIENRIAADDTDVDLLLGVDEALERLAAEAPRPAKVVEMRYFAGLSVDETAAAMDISARTVDMDWAFARAWLHRELSK